MMISWYITADDDNGHQEISVRTSELGIGVTLSIRFRSSTWVENSQDDQDACSHFQVEANSIFHFPFLIFFVFLYFSNLEDAENIPQIGIVPRVLIELWWSLPKELEVQRDTNVARLQTTTIYNFFNKHLDRWRIKEYTSSQSMYNVMSLNFLRSSNVSCFSTKKHTHQVTFKSPENTIEATRKCCGWWFGNLLGHRDRLSICWVSFGFRFFSVDHGLGIPGGEWLMGEDGGYDLPWNESKLDELRFLGFLFNLLDECFFFWFLGCLKC